MAPLPKLIALGRRRVLTKRSDGVRFRGLRLLWATTIVLIEATGMFLASGAMTGRRVWGPKMSNAHFRLSGSVRSLALLPKLAFVAAPAPNGLIVLAALISRRSELKLCDTSSPTPAASHD